MEEKTVLLDFNNLPVSSQDEILKLWRGLGFLRGLQEGSINEWRCAKSYNDVATYLTETDNNDLQKLSVIVFPFIRKCLTTGKKRLYRFIKAEELFSFFKEVTLEELHQFISNITTNSKNCHIYQICNNMTKSILYKEWTLLEFFTKLENNDTSIQNLTELFDNVFDIKATFLSISSDYFVIKNK